MKQSQGFMQSFKSIRHVEIKMPKQNESYSTIKNVCFKAIKAQKNPEL